MIIFFIELINSIGIRIKQFRTIYQTYQYLFHLDIYWKIFLKLAQLSNSWEKESFSLILHSRIWLIKSLYFLPIKLYPMFRIILLSPSCPSLLLLFSLLSFPLLPFSLFLATLFLSSLRNAFWSFTIPVCIFNFLLNRKYSNCSNFIVNFHL